MENLTLNENTPREDGVSEEVAINPFMIDLVVENICKFLDYQELKVCRSLNKLWNEKTTLYLKLCPDLILGSENSDKSQIHLTIRQFMENFENPSNTHQYGKLINRCRNFVVKDINKENILLLRDFMVKVGPQLLNLDLYNVRFSSYPQILDDLLFSYYTPFLESLYLKDEKYETLYNSEHEIMENHRKENKNLYTLDICLSRDFHRTEVPSFWLNVLNLYPNLKKFSVEHLSEREKADIFSALVTIRNADERKLNLKKFFCGYGPFNILERANLSLERMGISGFNLNHDDTASSFLETQIETLKTLFVVSPKTDTFPRLENLEDLYIIYGDAEILPKVPNIKSLKATQWIWDMPLYSSPITSLTDLNLGVWQLWDINALIAIPLWFPNLRVLKLNPDINVFRWVCKNLPNLRKLIIRNSKLNDAAITGKGIFGKAYPNITCLQKLESFRMVEYAEPRKGLTDKSVEAFLCLPLLSTLEINLKREFSDHAMTALTSKIKNVKIKDAWKG